MSKLTTSILAAASVAITNVTAAQAFTNPAEAFNPNPTFPNEFEEKAEVSKQSMENLNFEQEVEETELAHHYYECSWVTYPNGWTNYICYYY